VVSHLNDNNNIFFSPFDDLVIVCISKEQRRKNNDAIRNGFEGEKKIHFVLLILIKDRIRFDSSFVKQKFLMTY
jgi:hypothetical protein